MLRILIGILVICCLNERATSQLPVGLSDIKEAYDENMKAYQKICQDKKSNMTKEYIETLLNNVTRSMLELRNLDNKVQPGCGATLRSVFVDFDDDDELHTSIQDLCHNIETVNGFFEDSAAFGIENSFTNETFQSFAHEVLWGDINLPDTFEDLYELFSSSMFGYGLLSRLQERSLQFLEKDCDTQISTQQQVLYIYLQLVIAEFKGLITIQKIYLIKRVYNNNSGTYIAEQQYAERNYKTRLTDYHRQFTQLISMFPRFIRRCDVQKPNRGVNFIELERFSRFTFLDQELRRNFTCLSCPSQTEIEKISAVTNTTLYNCLSVGPVVAGCPAENGSSRDYMWWEVKNGAVYGHKTTCEQENIIVGRSRPAHILYTPNFSQSCALCACSTDQNKTVPDDKSTIWRISVTNQIADLEHNMVVTGVKFVTQDNAIHLQIHQANFTHGGIIDTDGGWKPLNQMFFDKGFKQTDGPMSYEALRYDQKSLLLDDIVVPDGKVITGVRFKREGNAFKLQVYASSFDFESGDVDPFGDEWIDALTSPMRPKDYEHKRVEINMDNSDDPTKNSHFVYDLTSNKQIKFIHTDIHKDAGQTTIPLLDAQPVEASPLFPLGGIGLSYRGSNNSSGYVAPRIFTMDITNYMYSINKTPDEQNFTTINPFPEDTDNN